MYALSDFQDAINKLKESLAAIDEKSQNARSAQELTKYFLKFFQRSCRALLDQVSLKIYSRTSSLSAGEKQEVALIVHNDGALPLNSITLSSEDYPIQNRVYLDESGEDNPLQTEAYIAKGETMEIGYLAEGEEKSIDTEIITPEQGETYTIHFKWNAWQLDGQSVNGTQEITFQLQTEEIREVADIESWGGSPYFVSEPVGPNRDDVFFGREQLLEQIKRQITGGNAVLLEGNRRAGKTSILKHLEGAGTVSGWLGVYCSLQGPQGRQGAGVATVDVWREMARSVAEGLVRIEGETPLPDGTSLAHGKELGIGKACKRGISDSSPWDDFRDYLGVVLERLSGAGMGILFLFDEFDKLQEGIDSGITSPQIPENIRYLIQNYPKVSAVLTGSRRMKRLREEYWSALYGLGIRFGVSALDLDSARMLVTEPVRGRLVYSKAAIELTVELTARQPFLLQCLCNQVFELAYETRTGSVTRGMVNQAAQRLVKDNEHLAALWGYSKTEVRRYILTICAFESEGKDGLTFGFIHEKLADSGISIDDQSLADNLEFLRELELIEMKRRLAGGHYRLRIPLMALWIEQQQDYLAQRGRALNEMEVENGE